MSTPLLTPGVYRQETVPVPPARLPTGVPAFIGYAQPTTPQPVLTRVEDLDSLGIELPRTSLLAAAIRGFFANGGQRCVVAAVDPRRPPKAGAVEADLVVRDPQLDEAAFGAALEALAARDDIDLVALPDLMLLPALNAKRVQARALALCARLGDRIAILDALPGLDPAGVIAQANDIRAGLGEVIEGALYYPWIATQPGRFIPPCGHVAGVIARTDAAVGVFKAPANAPLNEVIDLQLLVDDAAQGPLNQSGVNCLRLLPGRGIRVWGARTLSRDPDWRYLSVRRLLHSLNRWIDLNLGWVVFEPNAAPLWARIERELRTQLHRLWQAGALLGEQPEEAYFVRCDAANNPADSRDAGRLICEIGLAPTQPAEFITVRINLRAVETEDA